MNSQRSARLNLAASAVITVLVGGAIWMGINKFIVFAAMGVICVVVSLFFLRQRSGPHRDRLGAVAGSLGLTFEAGKVEISPDCRPGPPLFGPHGLCENRMTGKLDGADAALFELTTNDQRSADAGYRHWTVIVFSHSQLPDFVCIPKMWTTLGDRSAFTSISFNAEEGDEVTRAAVADFEKAYMLGLSKRATETGEAAVRRLFGVPRLMAMAEHPGWYILSAGARLVFAQEGFSPAADRPAMWREAGELRHALLAPVSHAATPIPAAPGWNRAASFSAAPAGAGGLAGAVVGFFGGFIAFAALMSGRIGPHAPAMGPTPSAILLPALFGIVLGGPLAGGIAGAWLGGRVADLRYRPTLPGETSGGRGHARPGSQQMDSRPEDNTFGARSLSPGFTGGWIAGPSKMALGSWTATLGALD